MMTVVLPCEPSSSLSVAACRSRRTSRSRRTCTNVFAILARDVVIDFGKFKGCKMGTLPSSYLRWLVKESISSSLSVWGDHAQQVLHDPYYQDRLEWQTIEKLTVRGDMRRGGPPTGTAGVKDSMQALGWDLSDHSAWSHVNFSLLGTTLGGRIPRKKPDPSASSPSFPVSKPRATRATIANLKRTVSKPRSASGIPTMEASLTDKLLASSSPKTPTLKSSLYNSATGKQDPKVKPSQSLSLQEELLRRRQLRKERSAAETLKKLPRNPKGVGVSFPGRESLLKRVRNRADK